MAMEKTDKKELIRIIYLYLFSLVGLVLVTIGLVRLIDLGLKAFIFIKADRAIVYPEYPRAIKSTPGLETPIQEELSPEQQEKFKQEQSRFEKESRESNRQREAANSLAMIIVGAPLFLYHWRTIQGNKKRM